MVVPSNHLSPWPVSKRQSQAAAAAPPTLFARWQGGHAGGGAQW
uniref:Uncharacterized protein n=1 Tax=Arundo donax TaxID=35708 RepID=A0A0A8Z366_ARUDO